MDAGNGDAEKRDDDRDLSDDAGQYVEELACPPALLGVCELAFQMLGLGSYQQCAVEVVRV